MGKVKNRNHSEIEHLRGLVKELKKENGQLRRKVKDLEKYSHQYEDVIENHLMDEPEMEIVEKAAICPSCKKGNLKITLNWENMQIFDCDQCDFRKTVKT